VLGGIVRVEHVLLIRHGETDWNAQRRWQGLEPTPLNAQGMAQARALARYLQGCPIGAVYSSDQPRALQTAMELARILKLEPVTDARWREIDVGVFQGLTAAEAEQQYPDVMGIWHSGDLDYALPGGESRRSLGQRAKAAWGELIANGAGSQVAVVTHGGTIRHLLRELFSDEADYVNIAIPNTSVTTVSQVNGSWRVAQLAAIDHLTPVGQAADSGDDYHPIQ
jgi:probable phosphoglycerate mutase